jgi:hypothetical protein
MAIQGIKNISKKINFTTNTEFHNELFNTDQQRFLKFLSTINEHTPSCIK